MFFLSLKDLVSMKSDLGEIRFRSVYNWSRCASTKCSARVAELGVLGKGDRLNIAKHGKKILDRKKDRLL